MFKINFHFIFLKANLNKVVFHCNLKRIISIFDNKFPNFYIVTN